MRIEWAPEAAQGPKPSADVPKSAEIAARAKASVYPRLQAKGSDGARLQYRLRSERSQVQILPGALEKPW
jgi:hypothetical protein